MRSSGVAVNGRMRGFTLLELMTVVAIIGLLAAVAMPSYERYIVKNNRAAAQAALMDVAQRQQQLLLDTRSYACTTACTTTAMTQTALSLTVPPKVSDLYVVKVTASAGPPPSFIATAAPIAGKRQVPDGDLTIDNLGAKLPADKW